MVGMRLARSLVPLTDSQMNRRESCQNDRPANDYSWSTRNETREEVEPDAVVHTAGQYDRENGPRAQSDNRMGNN